MPRLPWLALTSAALLLGACTPATTTGPSGTSGTGGTSSSGPGPLPAGETWTISGLDQNNNKLEGKITLRGAPRYDAQDREWTYPADRGEIYVFEEGTGARLVVWDTSDAKRLVACVIFRSFSATQESYTGAGLAGSNEEINAVFSKLSGSGTRLVGGDCKVTRSAKP